VNILSAIVAGLIGTVAMTLVMAIAPKMGMPKMDIIGMLSTMFGKQNRPLGMGLHLMMGIAFALVYAFLWSSGVGAATLTGGVLFGIVHWLVVGAMMAGMPMMHAGIKAGKVPAPGAYMQNNGGSKAFIGGLMGHILFGMVVALVYAAI
jgi:uncharacterized membrane protein YagU involved in acid resistance